MKQLNSVREEGRDMVKQKNNGKGNSNEGKSFFVLSSLTSSLPCKQKKSVYHLGQDEKYFSAFPRARKIVKAQKLFYRKHFAC
ncbi:CLUMA_CG003515, isoform A [Clunio marinus]|uniref:CLUMA_CG003515, isoform A n=1 Tax=Clunio marinus TaxID=568069 RepID=A0A1J1HQA3_9DIPT|nr:CLUMA_CG003515, isoform A [Clunio marinus]